MVKQEDKQVPLSSLLVWQKTPKVPWYKTVAQQVGEVIGQALFGGGR